MDAERRGARQRADFAQYARTLYRIAGLGAGVLLSACGSEAPTLQEQPAVMTAEIVSPLQQSWPETIAASGEVTAWQEAIIGAEVAGVRIDEVLVDVGDQVRKNQLLARHSEEALSAELARLDAGLAEAEANLAKAQAEAARAVALQAADAMSAQAAQMYETQARVAEAQRASMRAQREAQALRLRHARVVAPDDGVISARSATVGAVSMVGAELFRLVRRGRLEWRAEVPGEALARLQPGATVELRTHAGNSVQGTLRTLAPTLDPRTRNALAYVDLPADKSLAAGMYLAGQFRLAASEALTMPEMAVVLRDGNSYLMRVDGERRVRQIKVRTGRRRDGAIEILDGITPGDRFVRSGGAFLADGDLVDIASDQPAAERQAP